jgi:hypothetical protein
MDYAELVPRSGRRALEIESTDAEATFTAGP